MAHNTYGTRDDDTFLDRHALTIALALLAFLMAMAAYRLPGQTAAAVLAAFGAGQ